VRTRSRVAIATIAALLVLPGVALAQEADPAVEPGNEAIAEEVVAEAEAAKAEADAVLATVLELDLGEGAEPVLVTIEEALERLAGGTLLDPNAAEPSAINAGDVMHIYVDVNVESFPFPGLPASATLPPAPVLTHYDVVESGFVPSTPLVPVPNPLLLTGQELPEGLPPGLASPILFLHAGGRLKNVQGSGWDTGTHTVGSGPLGPNIDTSPRVTTPDDPWPIWLPVVTGGVIPDTSLDFTGFAIVIQGQGCSLVQVPIPFLGLRTFARICIGFGTLIGDGLTFFNGAPPVDIRGTLAPLWGPPPPPLDGVVTTLEEALASIPLGEVLATILGAIPPPPTGMPSARLMKGLA
jgi:hypothetical protein